MAKLVAALAHAKLKSFVGDYLIGQDLAFRLSLTVATKYYFLRA